MLSYVVICHTNVHVKLCLVFYYLMYDWCDFLQVENSALTDEHSTDVKNSLSLLKL